MNTHPFLFQPGIWIGEGHVAFFGSQDTVKFYTRWQILDPGPKKLILLQEVEIHGVDPKNRNTFTFTEITDSKFQVLLENESMGSVLGKGVIDDKTIAWELRDHTGFEGYEVYELKDSGEYHFHAEYVSGEPFRTLIDGRVWKKL